MVSWHRLRASLVLGAITIFFALATATPALAVPTALVVNGRPLQPDVPPVCENGRLLVPLRTAAEALGATVTYDATARTVTVKKQGALITLGVGAAWARAGDQTLTLEVPAQVAGGRVLVPLRFLGEALGAYVSWNPVAQAVYLSDSLLGLPGWSQPLGGTPPVVFRDGEEAGVRLLCPTAGFVTAEACVDITARVQTAFTELIAVVEKEGERSDQPVAVRNGLATGRVWLPFGPGDYRVTLCSPPENDTLAGRVQFRVRNLGRTELRYLVPTDWIDWDHPEILKLARQLKRDKPWETVLAVHDWVAKEITYDTAAARLPRIPHKRASEVLFTRSGVCEDFSRLFAALCRANGIPAAVVRGLARQENEPWPPQPNHAWNEVLVNGRWITVDVTWDAGHLDDGRFNREFRRDYFDPDPTRFALTHRKSAL
ncbi:stalk domain-containing protein [Thermodesulfitimonas sp.]